MNGEIIVDAIEEGKIVKVTEAYAKREGLPILRKPKSLELQRTASEISFDKTREKKEERTNIVDKLHKKESWRESQVLSELVDNFHWIIRVERRKKGLSRNQLAKLINEPEDSLRQLEFGILPFHDFVLINKIQQTLKVNLRKDGRDFSKSVKDIIKNSEIVNMESEDKIEILDEDI
ncbi:hypothetical protein HY450_03790 [Candidatus Pacearchaeota archaeon]|nr:hypothetical protein [Candidatus Pacearchaeota archaeon]